MWALEYHTSLRVIYICLLMAFIFVIVFAFYNVCQYLTKLQRQRSWMIVAFYILVILQATSHVGVFGILSVKPSYSPFFFDGAKNLNIWIQVFELIGCQSAKLIYWLVVFITFHLSMSLCVLLGRLPSTKAKLYNKIMVIGIVIINVIDFSLMSFFIRHFIEKDKRNWVISLDYGISTSILIVVYAIVLVLFFK